MADQHLIDAHQPRWAGVWVWLALAAVHYGLQALTVWAVFTGHWWLTAACVLLIGQIMHGLLLGYHDASHGTLAPKYWLNESLGILVGVHAFVPLSLYRIVHHYHHIYLSSERDEEFWPFVNPGTPRGLRCLAAFAELAVGFFYSPFIFLRSFLRKESPIQDPRLRRRICWELVLTAVVWTAVLALVARFGLWKYLLFAFVLPAIIAGNLQSWRKFVEHMGLAGTTVNSVTRSVVPETAFGRFLSTTMFNIAYHGVHHRYARMHSVELPEFTDLLIPEAEEELLPFPNYRSAILDMLVSLDDPRVGRQWLTDADRTAATRLVHIGRRGQVQRARAS
jgi:fatty acid desaturase